MTFFSKKLSYRRELQTAQSENFQLEKKIHELQMVLQNPSLASRLSDVANGSLSGLSPASSLSTGAATATPEVVRKYHEMKYGNKNSTNTSPSLIHSNMSSFDGTQSNINNSFATRNGMLSGKLSASSVPQPNITMGARNSTFKFTTKLPDSIQNTINNTSQSIQSKLPASLQNLQASLTEGTTINMLANKLQNAFS